MAGRSVELALLFLLSGMVARAEAAEGATRPDWSVPLESATWTPQPGWLGNPSPLAQVVAAGAKRATVFRVAGADQGMKWSWKPSQPISIVGYRYLSLRYRAVKTAKVEGGDYALCVVGKSTAAESAYVNVVPMRDLLADGCWHVINADLRPAAAQFEQIHSLAVQVQAADGEAVLEVSDIRLTNTAQPARLADAVDWKAGAEFQGFQAVDLSAAARDNSAVWRARLQLDQWFPQPVLTVHGIPMSLLAKQPDLASTTVEAKSDMRLPIGDRASEVYLLLAAHLVGDDEPAYGGGQFHAIRDVDRFRVRLEYADGSVDECLPMNVATKQFGIVAGIQTLVAAADDSKRLDAVVVRDLAKQAAFAVAAASLRVGGDRLFAQALEDAPPLKLARAATPASPWDYVKATPPLVELCVDGKAIDPANLEPASNPTNEPGRRIAEYRVRGIEGLRLGIEATAGEQGSLALAAWVRNEGGRQHTVDLTAPMIGPYRLGKNPDDGFYLFPKCGAVFDNRDCSFRARYCGEFPLQFIDTFDPRSGRGLVLRTLDTSCVSKAYVLQKRDGSFRVGVAYPRIALKPGELFRTPPATLQSTDGDWHRGLEAYGRWLATWHHAQTARKPWFREAFNFRQQFLSNWLYDKQEGVFHLERAIDEARREFGGIDFLHLNDWGNNQAQLRIYGRTGEEPPYDRFRGGGEAFRQAIAKVQARGVPVGLYIEGYLLDERGKLGREHGRRWQMLGADGSRSYWPDSREMYACPAVSEWREVQCSTYAARVRELNVDGMYIDQFGFAGPWRDCWAKDHGHEVPSYAVAVERDCTRAVRRRIAAVREGGVLYTEETPVDVTTQEQDGSFTYAMFNAQRMPLRVPLNLSRFAIPDFKTFEILFCDKPTGSWATGVKWVFFNGEGLWLELPAETAFEPETREAIRRCYAILHKHRDAFTTLRPTPLVATEMGGVYANRFPAGAKTVYTLYNARHRTVRGEVLRIAGAGEAACVDAWNDRPAHTRREGADWIVSLEIGPQDVGCIVVQPR
jgi:hypothetical protein